MVNDNVAELDETLIVTVVAASADIQVHPDFSTRTLTITDDDEHPTLSFASQTVSVDEDDSPRNPHGHQDRTQRVSRYIVDYETVGRKTCHRRPGLRRHIRDPDLPTGRVFQDDFSPHHQQQHLQGLCQPAIRRRPELLPTIQPLRPTSPNLDQRLAVVTIINDDPVPTASMANVTANERAGTMTLTLRLSNPSSQDISYRTASTTSM